MTAPATSASPKPSDRPRAEAHRLASRQALHALLALVGLAWHWRCRRPAPDR